MSGVRMDCRLDAAGSTDDPAVVKACAQVLPMGGIVPFDRVALHAERDSLCLEEHARVTLLNANHCFNRTPNIDSTL